MSESDSDDGFEFDVEERTKLNNARRRGEWVWAEERLDDLDTLPEFDLDYLVDEEQDPSEVTVFPNVMDEGHIETHWITIDIEHALCLEEML